MRAMEAARKLLVTIPGHATLTEAGRLMDEKVVGALVIMDGDDASGSSPIGTSSCEAWHEVCRVTHAWTA